MKCGSHRHEGVEEIPDADFITAWDEYRAWLAANPVDRNNEEKVRNAVRSVLLPRLPPPRDTSSQWWMMLCMLSGDLITGQTWPERARIIWAYWGVIGKPIGDRPVPGEDFDL